MTYNECKKEFIKLINSIGRSRGRWDILSDFATMARCAIINNSTPFRSEEYEKQYMNIVGRYPRDELDSFCRMLALVYMAQRDNDGDFLGECLMELEMGSKDIGQFFTPYSVCQATAKLTMGQASELTCRKGYLTLQEPAAGGGAMVIAAAHELRTQNNGIDIFAVCTELSSLTADLCYINLTAAGIAAQVINGNTLTLEAFRTMPTPAACTNIWTHRLTFSPRDEAVTTIRLTHQDTRESFDTGLTDINDAAMALGEEPWLVCSDRLHVFKEYVATDYEL